MSDFEGLFGLFGLMFGLIVAELALKFADAINSNRERPIGILTPALAFLVLTDVTSFWVFIWALRSALKVNWHTVLAESFQCVFSWQQALCSRARAADGFISTNITGRANGWSRAVSCSRTRHHRHDDDARRPGLERFVGLFLFAGYLAALAGLALSRSRRLDYVFLIWAIGINLLGRRRNSSRLPMGSQDRFGLLCTAASHLATVACGQHSVHDR